MTNCRILNLIQDAAVLLFGEILSIINESYRATELAQAVRRYQPDRAHPQNTGIIRNVCRPDLSVRDTIYGKLKQAIAK